MTEEEKKEVQSKKENEIKIMNDYEITDLEKDIENYMKFKVPRNQKTSLIDPLDILVKEPNLIPIEKQLEKYKDEPKDTNSIKEEKEIKEKKYNSGLQIKYCLDKNGQMEIISIDEKSINDKMLKDLESSIDFDLELYIKKLFCKMNYSPIIKRVFGKKITFAELEELAILWRFYVELKIKKDEKSIEEFRKKLLKTMTKNVQLLIRHIFSIMRIREAIASIENVFQNHYFHLLKKAEKRSIEDAYDMRTTRLDSNKEISGNGACFILIKELKRALNMLLYSSQYLFYSFEPIFKKDFNYLYMTLRKIFYVFFDGNCFFSTLLFNMKAIFIRSDMKEVCNEIDNLTLPFEYDFDKKFIKEEYKDIEFEDTKELLFDFKKCFDQLGYSVDKNDEKGEEVIIETEEAKKVNEIKDIDELLKYIEGDSSQKKKKKKKKKKDNPINILDKLREEEKKNLDDETMSQSSLSYISHDSVVSAFKREVRAETSDNDFDKIKPIFSEDFISKYK